METRQNGLVVIDAYFGLDEHIYQVDAGRLIYKPPEDEQDWYTAQIIPVKKKLQLMVKNT